MRALTPTILLAGLLTLLVYHFNATLSDLQRRQDQLNGIIGFSMGHLAIQLHRDGAAGRPTVLYGDQPVIAYDDAASTISVDGQIQELWNGDHGYSTDESKRQVFSTSTGPDWQVVQVTQLIDSHSVSVSFFLVIRPLRGAALHQVVLYVVHGQHVWAAPRVTGAVFSATVLPPPPPAVPNPLVLPLGELSVTASGPALQPSSLAANTVTAAGEQGSLTSTWATSFTTTYAIENPPPQTLLPLGSETITFDTRPPGSAAPVTFPTGAS